MNIWQRPKNRRKQNQRRLRLPAINLRRWGIAAAVVLGLVAAVAAVSLLLDQPIQRILISGSFQRVSPGDIERAVKDKARSKGLVSVDLDAVRAAVAAIPWVDTVSVQRAWPRALTVTVVEQVAAARWGESGLLNTRGELFASEATHIPPELARLSGPPGTQGAVAARYLAAQGRLVEAGMHLTALRLDERGAWEMDLADGITVRLGSREVDERFERFMLTAMKLITPRADEIAYVDMRYSNGFAIGWKAGGTRRTGEDGGKDA
ncbi:MAG TPA: cell division protein FtsQ/DivIB [Steroidobacteraceae bacterium]